MIAVRMIETSVSRRFRFAIFPVASRSLVLERRSFQASTCRATHPLDRETSHASAKSVTMTRMLPNGG